MSLAENIQMVKEKIARAALEAGRFDLYLGEVALTADFDLSALLSSDGALNYGRWQDEQTDLLLAMNQWDYHTAQRLHLGRRIAWVPGIGVDFSKLDAPPGGCSRSTYGLDPEDFVLLYAAEFSSRKNQSMLIRALPSLPQQVKLLLPGQSVRI